MVTTTLIYLRDRLNIAMDRDISNLSKRKDDDMVTTTLIYLKDRLNIVMDEEISNLCNN